MNAIEVLEERLAKGKPVEYRSVKWWDEQQARHAQEYPYPAATPYEVTPATGAPIGD